MKKVYLLISGLFISSVLVAQEVKNVGIGTVAPDQSAVLDIQSTDKGLLIPRLTQTQMNKIVNPAKGLLVFNTEAASSGFFFYNGEKWSPLTNGEANAIATVDANGWALDGNATTTVNKTAATAASFIGTPAGIPINFKIGSSTAGSIRNDGNMFLGFMSGANLTSGTTNVGVGEYTLNELTVGASNTALGTGSLRRNSSGNSNLGIGSLALSFNTSGSANVGIGHGAMYRNVSGANNLGLGKDALFNSTSGSFNVAIGTGALVASTTGNNNTAIGFNAGAASIIGTSNVFIGYRAGGSETGSNKLYIATSNTTTPLVYGDFSAKFLSIGDVPVAKRDAVASSGQYSLIVEKGILSEKLKVALKSSTDWADYVFEQDYKDNMMSLEEVEAFTLENKHLPNVPSAKELVEKGLDFNETSRMFMEKIEELTLYMIELNKEVKTLKAENANLKEMIKK